MIPVLYPTGVQEIFELGLHGFAMSRYSGCYVAFKTISETVDSSASIAVDPSQPRIVLPEDFVLPAAGLNIRWPDAPMEQELRLQHDKIYAALAYRAREPPQPRGHRFAQPAPGHHHLGQELSRRAARRSRTWASTSGTRPRSAFASARSACPGPSSPTACASSPRGCDEILVVEEKRQLIEYQMKEQLYNWPDGERPRVIGKYDEHGEWEVHRSEWLLPAAGELTPAMIAKVIARRIGKFA